MVNMFAKKASPILAQAQAPTPPPVLPATPAPTPPPVMPTPFDPLMQRVAERRARAGAVMAGRRSTILTNALNRVAPSGNYSAKTLGAS